MADVTSYERQWLVLKVLSARRRGATLRDLAREAGVSQRTMRRDLALLSKAGHVLVCDQGRRGVKNWRVQHINGQTTTSFNFDELAALYLGQRRLKPLAGTTFGDAGQAALAKIRAGLSEVALDYLDHLAEAVHLTGASPLEYDEKAELIDILRTAIEDRRVTLLYYRPLRATEKESYEVYPLGLVLHRHSMYLAAWSVKSAEMRTFKVDRIEEAELSKASFVLPQQLGGFSLEQFLANTFGVFEQPGPPERVRIRFAAEVARYIGESQWHASQQVEKLPSGDVILQLELSAFQELRAWIFSFGSRAEVLEPLKLRAEVVKEFEKSLQNYAARWAPKVSGEIHES